MPIDKTNPTVTTNPMNDQSSGSALDTSTGPSKSGNMEGSPTPDVNEDAPEVALGSASHQNVPSCATNKNKGSKGKRKSETTEGQPTQSKRKKPAGKVATPCDHNTLVSGRTKRVYVSIAFCHLPLTQSLSGLNQHRQDYKWKQKSKGNNFYTLIHPPSSKTTDTLLTLSPPHFNYLDILYSALSSIPHLSVSHSNIR